MIFPTAAILGSGSFGTAIATLLSPKLDRIELIGREADVAEGINTRGRNPKYLINIDLGPNISGGTRMEAAAGHPLIVFTVPTAAVRECATFLAGIGIPKETVILSCAKGIEKNTGERMSSIISKLLPENTVAVMSGPNHAEEIAIGQVACAVIGCVDVDGAGALQNLFTSGHFRPYTSTDIAGIELGGAIKNVYAIAAGIAHGLGLGDNAVAALVTRAFAEMTRLGTALGGRVETFAGLSGVGDLLATCFSEHSRNHRVGFALGRGDTLAHATGALGMVAEGVPNTLSIHEAARKQGVRTPIIDAVHSILYENKPAAEAMTELLTRDTRTESE